MKTPGSTTSSSIDSTSVSYQELVNFKKGTKCHAAAIDILKDDKYYAIFHRGFIATARAQGPSNVCDPDYKPKKEDPYKLEEQQSFVFSVLIEVIQTDYGRSLVRQHDCDHDTKVVLKEHHELSYQFSSLSRRNHQVDQVYHQSQSY